ncbi:MAG TPA: hypothetical protein PLQ41_00775 [bacterium]|nr:hypothetical protein [bacterium]HPP29658.1 hypothetical protein [bacterium]
MENEVLKDYPVFHAGIKKVMHHELGVEINSQTSVRYMRFLRKVSIDKLELPLHVYGRGAPAVPVHPARVVVSVLDRKNMCWSPIKIAEFAPRDSISGKGLNQKMSAAEMDEYFRNVINNGPPYIIELNGLETDHLRIECEREHPVWPNHGECNGGPYNVPFGLLNPLKAIGRVIGPLPENREWVRPLSVKKNKPYAPSGMSVHELPHMILYKGRYFSAGFSTVRPMLFHLGWDVEGGDLSETNRLLTVRHYYVQQLLGGLSGPLLRTLEKDNPCWFWNGEIEISGDRIAYRNIDCDEGISLDIFFNVREDGMQIEILSRCDRTIPAIEWGAWRFLWDLEKGITSTAGIPDMREGRNGKVMLPACFVGSGAGCLFFDRIEGDECYIQTEIYRYLWKNCRSDDIVSVPLSEKGGPIILPEGMRKLVIDFSVDNLLPENTGTLKEIPASLSRTWSSIFSTFRAEKGGFSNNANSVNCHQNQFVCADLVPFTIRRKGSFDPLALAIYTIERAILDGGGYGYHRNLYMDSDPVLVSAAGRIFQVRGDVGWLERIKPGIIAAFRRMISNIGKEGLVVNHDLTGNSGSYRWSSNSCDCVGFGNIDAYVNAWCYRALRNLEAIFRALREQELEKESIKFAQGIKAAFADNLINPETGWVAGWKSLDGRLHDAAYLFVNGPACAFGLLEPAIARKALGNLESLRKEIGPRSGAYFGLPLNLLPIPMEDTYYSLYYYPMDTPFEGFCNGCLYPGGLYYIRALSIYGFEEEAERIVSELEKGYYHRVFNGRFKEGFEFFAWDGCETGYEGTFGPAFAGLYAVAVQRGYIKPLEPEWWPL